MKRAKLTVATLLLLLIGIAWSQPLPGISPADHPETSDLAQDKTKKKKKKGVYHGEATYYHDKYHGRPTASGEPYDKTKLTAAINQTKVPLSLGTVVEVTNEETNQKVEVKVNDKMSDQAKASIDLSRAAAEKIGLIQAGRLKVTIRVVESQK